MTDSGLRLMSSVVLTMSWKHQLTQITSNKKS